MPRDEVGTAFDVHERRPANPLKTQAVNQRAEAVTPAGRSKSILWVSAHRT